jgi:gas vesicle protein
MEGMTRKKETMENMNRVLMMVIGFVVGGLIAGGVALLMAPQSGVETRRKLKEGALEAQKKASAAVDDARNRMMETVDTATTEVKERASKVKEIGRRVGEEQSSSIQRGASDVMDVMK